MTPAQRADQIIDRFGRTTMGWPGGRYDDPNHVTGMRVGTLRKAIEEAIAQAVADERKPSEPDRFADRVAELLDVVAKMTPGEWTAIGTSVTDWDNELKTCTMEFLPNRFNYKQTDDAEGIAYLKNHAAQLVADLMAEVGRLRAALDKLARLGNEPHYGNSVGNDIARAALAGKDGG